MSEEPTINSNDDVLDDPAMDAELNSSIETLKAGNAVAVGAEAPKPSETEVTGSTGAEAPTNETGASGEVAGDSQATGANGAEDFRIPNKGKFESDEAFELRTEMFDLRQKLKSATTPEAKAALSGEIAKIKGNLKGLGSTERFTQPKIEQPKPEETPVEDPALKADQDRLRALGGATKDDIAQALAEQQAQIEVKSSIDTFLTRKPQLADEDTREAFLQFVDNNYVWQGKSGKALIGVLEMAYDNMFRPAETIQERVIQGANVQSKVNAMQFPGGTSGKIDLAPDKKQSVQELTALGMSEETARELISE